MRLDVRKLRHAFILCNITPVSIVFSYGIPADQRKNYSQAYNTASPCTVQVVVSVLFQLKERQPASAAKHPLANFTARAYLSLWTLDTLAEKDASSPSAPL